MVDYLVLGAGLIGLLTARELRLAGATVCVLERGEPGQEASWAGGGILSPLYPWRYPDAVTALAHWSQRHYPQLAEALYAETGIDPQWEASGLLILEDDEWELAQTWAGRWGMIVERVGRAELVSLEPNLGNAYIRGLWWPGMAQIRNPRLLQALKFQLASLGVSIIPYAEVTGFDVQGDRCRGVVTRQGHYQASAVVVTAGAWSGQLLQQTGLALPVKPIKGQMILFKGPPGLVHRIVLSKNHYLVPRRDGQVLAGSTVEDVGFDKRATATALEELRSAALTLIPALADTDVVQHWAGLRPASPQGIPFIMKHPKIMGIYINTGHFRNGVVTGYASARLITDIILNRTPHIDPGPYMWQGN